MFCLTDDKEDAVLGSLPLLSYRVRGVEPSENISRQFAFKVSHTLVEESRALKGSYVIAYAGNTLFIERRK